MLPGAKMLFEEVLSEGPLAYLEFNVTGERYASRYFDTSIVPGANTGIEIFAGNVPDPALATGLQFGCRHGWIYNALQLNYGSDDGRCWICWNSSGVANFYRPDGVSMALVSMMPGGKLSAYGESVDLGQDFQSSGESFFLGDVNEQGLPKGSSDSQGHARLFWAKFYERGALIHHFVPCLVGDEAALMDMVAGDVLRSTGSLPANSIRYGILESENLNGGGYKCVVSHACFSRFARHSRLWKEAA